MWFIKREGNKEILDILEFSCPFGRLESEECTLKKTFQHKMHKYQSLADEYTANTRKSARVHPIIVSSLGAIYSESMKCLKAVLKCRDTDLSKLGTWISEQSILGSFKLWIDYQRTNEHHHDREEVRTEIDLANKEEIEAIENEEDNEEEDKVDEESDEQEITTPITEEQEMGDIFSTEETEIENGTLTNEQMTPNEI
jgi:hypothetical protein